MTPSLRIRFWDRIQIGDGCWEWMGARRSGYGRVRITISGRKFDAQAHRVAYEQLVGPIPDGLQLDHLCRNPACVRPDHLEPVTGRENTLRSDGPTAVNARKTHCVNGHEFDADNTYLNSRGGRECRACGRDRHWRRFHMPKFVSTSDREAEAPVVKRGRAA